MKKRSYTSILFFFILFLGISTKNIAQYPYVHYFNSENSNEIIGQKVLYHLAPDIDSCLLIASEDGIVRYNGSEFIQYSQNHQSSNHLPIIDVHATISALNCDWVVPILKDNLVYFFDKGHHLDSVSIKSLDQGFKPLKSGQTILFKQLQKNLVCLHPLFANASSIVFFRRNQKGKIEQIPTPNNFFKDIKNSWYVQEDVVVDSVNKRIHFYKNNQWESLNIQKDYIPKTTFRRFNNLLFFNLTNDLHKTKIYLVCYDLDLKKEIGRKIVTNFGTKLYQLSTTQFLFLPTNGANVVLDKNLKTIPSHTFSAALLQNIKDLNFDSNHNIWLSLDDKTVAAIPKKALDCNEKYWKTSGTRRITSDKYGNVWFGQETGDLLCYHHQKLDTIRLSHPFRTFIRGILAVDNELWVGNDSQLLRLWIPSLQFNKINPVIEIKNLRHADTQANSYALAPHSMNAHLHFFQPIKNIIKDKNSNAVILLTSNAANIFKKSDKYHFITQNLVHDDTQRTYAAVFDKRDKLWIGRETGLYVGDNLIKSIPNIAINVIKLDSKGQIWVGTNGKGVWIVNPTTLKSQLINYTQKAKIFDIYLEEQGVWIAGDKGLSFWDANQKIYSYGFASGLPSTSINAILSKDTSLFIGTSNGFLEVNKRKFKENYLRPSILGFESAEISGKSLLANNHSFSYDENYLSVKLKDFSFDLKHKDFFYIYQLISSTDTIQQITPSTEFSKNFPSLAYGSYQFKVIRKGLDGQFYGQSPTLFFTIHPPFWKTVWFLLLTTFLSSLGVYFYLRKKRSMEMRLNNLELDALAAQINPHFIGNGLNVVADIILNENDKFKAYDFIAIFSAMVRQFMENTRKRTITVENEKKFLENYIEIERNRFSEITFDYDIQIQAPLSTEIPAGIMQPLVENAIKHGILRRNEPNGGKISIEFLKQGKFIQCIVEDNGKGLFVEQQGTHKSASLQNIKKRIDLMHNWHIYKTASIEFIDKTHFNQEGVRVVLTFKEK